MNSQEEQAQPVLVAFKLNFLNTCKWVQLPQNGFDFQSLKEISKKKFPEISLDATIFTDEEGVEIEEDFLESFIKLKGDKFLINIISTTTMSPEKTAPTIQILTVDQALQLQALSSSSSTVTFASPSGSTDNSVEPFNDFNPDGEGEPSGEPKKIYISAEELKTFLIQFKNCKYIFDEYEKSQLLSNDTRKKLVRAVANLMEENHMEITPKVLIHYSEALVELFPQYKAVNSKYPFEAFYNPISHGGFLSWRIKNNRRKSGEKCKQKRPVEESEVPEKKIQLCDDLEEKIIFLRNVNPVQRDAIRQKMIETFSYRRSAPEKILEEFPRFLDTPGLRNKIANLLASDV